MARKRIRRRNRERLRVEAKQTMRIVAPLGWQTVLHGASEFLPCRCVTHELAGIPAAPFIWREHEDTYQLRCGVCGTRWSRSIPANARTGRLCLGAAHPEERAARRTAERER